MGRKDFIRLKDFCVIEKAIIVGNNIAIERGPFTKTPREKASHTN